MSCKFSTAQKSKSGEKAEVQFNEQRRRRMSKTELQLKEKQDKEEDDSLPKYYSPDIFNISTLKNFRWKENIDEDGTIKLKYISTEDKFPGQIVRKYKIFCADKYQHHDIGAYLEGGIDKCKCDTYFFPPSFYQEVKQVIQKDSQDNYRMKNEVTFKFNNFENLQNLYSESQMPETPSLQPWRSKRKCYIAFDKASFSQENEHITQTYGYPYDQLKNARILRAKDKFIIWMDAFDTEGKSLGLVYAKKLELDIEAFGCNKCKVQDRWKYKNVEDNALQNNQEEYNKIKSIGKELNKENGKDILNFWKSHQAVLLLPKYCLKINKTLKFNEVNKGNTYVDINEKFYDLGLYRIVNLDLKNTEDTYYRYLIHVDRKCILKKFFGKTYPE